MPIEFTCPQCESLLRVDDANAGKRARCPHCSSINRIPGELVDQTPAAPVSQQFFIDSVSGQTYGPILKSELDEWVSQGRISGSCLIRGTGQQTGQPASVYYPSLAEKSPLPEFGHSSKTAGPSVPTSPGKQPGFDPYAAPTLPAGKPGDQQAYVADGINPVKIDLGQVFSFSFQLFTQHIGILIAAAAVCLIPQVFIQIIEAATENRGIGPVGLIGLVILNLTQTFLVIGQTRIALRIVRGQPVEFSELFSGGDKFLAVIGFSIVIIIPLMCSILLLVVPFIFLLLFFWPAYSLIIDHKSTVMDSFGIAHGIGSVNLFNSFVLGLASFGIAVVGLMACGVGLIFSSGFLSVLWAAAYLMMSGQVRVRTSQ